MKIYIKSETVKTRDSIQNNFNEWGMSADTNILYILGYSGSGKSTKAKELAQQYNADIINLDLYFTGMMDTSNLAGSIKSLDRSSLFDTYCRSYFPEYEQFQSPDEYLSSSEQEELLRKFEQAILDYGRYMYSRGKRVIVEGVQLMDNTLFPNKSFFKSVPTLLLSANKFVSSWRGIKRDKPSLTNYLTNVKYNGESRSDYRNIQRALGD